jgi:hypothetical protein
MTAVVESVRVPFRAAICAVFALMAGCGIQFSNLDPATRMSGEEGDAVVVLAVRPRSRVSLFEGEGEGEEWTCKSSFNIANVFPEGGFIVLKLKPRVGSKNYGIGQVLPDGIGGQRFIVRRDAMIPAFHAPAGKVTFVGGILLARRRGYVTVAPDEATTVEDAERFLRSTYPGLGGGVDQDPLVFLRADGGC